MYLKVLPRHFTADPNPRALNKIQSTVWAICIGNSMVSSAIWMVRRTSAI